MGASGDQTFIRINENLVNAETLSVSTLVADAGFLGESTARRGLSAGRQPSEGCRVDGPPRTVRGSAAE